METARGKATKSSCRLNRELLPFNQFIFILHDRGYFMNVRDEQSQQGEFLRQEDQFQDWVTRDGSSGYGAEPNRYHLYVSLACPWAHRTIVTRKLKRLEDVVGLTGPTGGRFMSWRQVLSSKHSRYCVAGGCCLARGTATAHCCRRGLRPQTGKRQCRNRARNASDG